MTWWRVEVRPRCHGWTWRTAALCPEIGIARQVEQLIADDEMDCEVRTVPHEEAAE